jgi:hypothetical protein
MKKTTGKLIILIVLSQLCFLPLLASDESFAVQILIGKGLFVSSRLQGRNGLGDRVFRADLVPSLHDPPFFIDEE